MHTWPHAPSRKVTGPGMYMVTGSTYLKQHFFRNPESTEFLHDALLSLAIDYGWSLEAWAVFSNHYHFVGHSPDKERAVFALVNKLHSDTARWANERDSTPGRRVWYNYRESIITFEKSYLARMSYVFHNPVKHGLVRQAVDYPYCSARWFVENAPPAYTSTVIRFPHDRLAIEDDF